MAQLSTLKLRPWLALPALILACALVLGLAPRAAPPPAEASLSPNSADIDGTVRDAATGLPVSGARVEIPDLGLETTSDSNGRFSWSDIPLTQPRQLSLIRVTAAGFGEWTLRDAWLLPYDALLITVELKTDPVEILVPEARSQPSDWPDAPGATELDTPTDDSNLPLPGFIRVRVTGYPYCDTTRPYTVQVIDFKQYAKHVLPNEWVNSWPHESLRAGAMAVKMYAWSYIAIGGKWPDADVYDSTCDQVYNPAVAYTSTNNAVDFTWNFRLLRSDNNLFRTFYRAYLSQCQRRRLGTCMGQWETRDDAYDLLTWDEILRKYYYNSWINAVWNPPGGWSLRYYGNGYGDLDRVKIRIDDPANSNPGPPADVGAEDFTIEWWMKVPSGVNNAPAVTCGANADWVYGNTLIDRDRFGQDSRFRHLARQQPAGLRRQRRRHR